MTNKNNCQWWYLPIFFHGYVGSTPGLCSKLDNNNHQQQQQQHQQHHPWPSHGCHFLSIAVTKLAGKNTIRPTKTPRKTWSGCTTFLDTTAGMEKQMSNAKKPWLVGLYRWWKTTQLYKDFNIRTKTLVGLGYCPVILGLNIRSHYKDIINHYNKPL